MRKKKLFILSPVMSLANDSTSTFIFESRTSSAISSHYKINELDLNEGAIRFGTQFTAILTL